MGFNRVRVKPQPQSSTTHDMGVLFALLGARAFWTFMSVYLLT
jgi:hypothetical protein